MSYAILPGLYAVGSPTADSPVLVTANYKLTFDALRGRLAGIDAWILVLDTKGVNVWCAAGKGTFGTAELLSRVAAVKLNEVVAHRTLILPQLGATGVSAPEVRKAAGWRVKYGPVVARDIPDFLACGMKKDAAMRTVLFKLPDRMTIAPAELAHSWPLLLGALVVSALLGLPFDTGTSRGCSPCASPSSARSWWAPSCSPRSCPSSPSARSPSRGRSWAPCGASSHHWRWGHRWPGRWL